MGVGGVKPSRYISIVITCKKGGGVPDSMLSCMYVLMEGPLGEMDQIELNYHTQIKHNESKILTLFFLGVRLK